MEINEPQITIESLLDRIREGAGRRAGANGVAGSGASSGAASAAGVRSEQQPASLDGFPALTRIDVAQLNLQPAFEPHAADEYHVNDLLKYHDRNFIQNAYLAILKRGPDATGFKAFIESLRSGRLNKIDVLARLRYSTEGRAKKVQVKGLFVPAAVRQLYRLPLIGYALRLSVAIARLPAAVRHQQQFEAHVHAQQQQVVDHANHLSDLLGQHQREAAHAFARLAEATHASNAQQQQLALRQQEQQANTDAQRAALDSQRALHDALALRFNAAHNELLERINAVKQQFDVLIDKAVSHWQREMAHLETRQAETNANALAHLHERAAQLTLSLRAEVSSLSAQLRDEVERVSTTLRTEQELLTHRERELRTELSLQAGRVARFLNEATQQLPASLDERQQQVLTDEQRHLHDAFYHSLEARFRGSPAEIKERLKIYLPLVAQAKIVSATQPLLDIGCGRGEWLELLSEADVPALGVDSNRALVTEGQARGLRIVEADLMAHLRALPADSLGALTGFHIVEHLPLETLLGLLDETVRVVKPGGLVIFETPNPENVLVGSCNFYFDPTHRNPLPAPVMKFMLESRGLSRVGVIRLNPSDAEPVAGDADIVKRFNQYFYGPMDYAVVGWKTDTENK